MAVGHDHHLGRAAAGRAVGRRGAPRRREQRAGGAAPREQRADLVGVERRAVAGHEQDALGAEREGGLDAERGRRGLAGLAVVVDDPRAGVAGRGGGARLGRDRHDAAEAGDRDERVEHVAGHRLGQLAPVRRTHGVGEAVLGARERLDGQDGDRDHGRRIVSRR